MNITNESSGWVSASQLTEDELTLLATRAIKPVEPELDIPKSLTEQYAESMLGRSVAPSSTASSPKTRDSSHKVPVNLCPASAIIAIALVIAQGHKKPGRTIYNWRSPENKISYMDYHGAAQRHLLRSIDGHDFDTELSELASGGEQDSYGNWTKRGQRDANGEFVVPVRHDWAAMSCLAIIEDARQAGTLVDDRPVKGGAEKFLDILQSAREKK